MTLSTLRRDFVIAAIGLVALFAVFQTARSFDQVGSWRADTTFAPAAQPVSAARGLRDDVAPRVAATDALASARARN